MDENQINFLKNQGYSEKMPNEVGLYLMACDEGDYKPDYVAITVSLRIGLLMSHSEDSGRIALEHLHEGLICPMWKKIA